MEPHLERWCDVLRVKFTGVYLDISIRNFYSTGSIPNPNIATGGMCMLIRFLYTYEWRTSEF